MQAIFRRKSFFDASFASTGTCCLRREIAEDEETQVLVRTRYKYLYNILLSALCGRSNYCVLPSMRPVLAFWHWAHVEGYIGGILDCPS